MSNDYDRYLTWGMEVPQGITIPTIDPETIPLAYWLPDCPNIGDWFPKWAAPMYALRNNDTATVLDPNGSPVVCTAPGWYTFSYGVTQYVPDEYFFGGTPDPSGGTVYPPQMEP